MQDEKATRYPTAYNMDDEVKPSQMGPVVESVTADAALAAAPNHRTSDPETPGYVSGAEKADSKVMTQVHVTNEGTVDINVDDAAAQLSSMLKPVMEHQAGGHHTSAKYPTKYIPAVFTTVPTSMNIVIHIVGSRGDVQPFISLGIVLKETYKHRVRVATHLIFKSFVEENGLEFFNIGGDPAELMAFMVKNPGLLPDLHTLASGEVGKRRKGIYEMLNGCWRSCIEPGDGTSHHPHPGHARDHSHDHDSEEKDHDLNYFPYHYDQISPFIADAIIANPPSFAHVHCAEKLGIPLHMMFTMPWSPTQSFPHPLVNIKSSNASADVTNYISYTLVDMLTWQGLGDVINKFRRKALNLEPVSVMWAPGMTQRLRIPFTYCWSPALIPKPKDWASHISISGFYFLSLASTYIPDKTLTDFLTAGSPPVYIGFGSIVVDDPDAMTKMILRAIEIAGIRALVSKGWGGLGDHLDQSDNVYMLGNIPHDYLFQHVSAVVHHGGAGTTAAGIAAGKPTVVVPFFGDQPFWGAMIHRAGAGPAPIPYKHLTAELLASQILEALKPETAQRARELGERMSREEGSAMGAKMFHGALDGGQQCALLPGRVAVWRLRRTNVLVSARAAAVLCRRAMIQEGDLKLHRPMEYETEDGPWDPVSGVASVIVGSISNLAVGAAELPQGVYNSIKSKASSRNSMETDASSLTSRPSISGTISSQSTLETPEIPRERSMSVVLEMHETLTQIPSHSAYTELATVKEVEADPLAAHNASSILASHPHLSAATVARLTTHSDTAPSKTSSDSALPSRTQILSTLTHAAGVTLAAPKALAESIAQGFHNAPKLYNDHTVRPQENVSDFGSGVKAAGRDFAHGIYDGVSGVVMQPYEGAKEGGVNGFVAGVAKGVGGLVLKPVGAIFALPADTLKGAYRSLQKTGDTRLLEHLIKSRITQGYREALSATEQEVQDVVDRWTIIKEEATRPASLNRAQTLVKSFSWGSHGKGVKGKRTHGGNTDKMGKDWLSGGRPERHRHGSEDTEGGEESAGEKVGGEMGGDTDSESEGSVVIGAGHWHRRWEKACPLRAAERWAQNLAHAHDGEVKTEPVVVSVGDEVQGADEIAQVKEPVTSTVVPVTVSVSTQ